MIEDAVYMGMKNDVSFLIADTVNLYEHQSSFNPNMPMRFLIYAVMLYDNYIETHSEYRRYSSVQQKAPTPKCVCFYNGTSQMSDIVTLRLSDTFASGSEPDIEVKVTMININYGHNSKLLEGCRPLRDYSYFVHETRVNQKILGSLEKAVDAAIEKLADDSLIKPFLMANRSEVKSMFITEYDEERAFAEQREDAREEGRAEGREEGRAEGKAEGKAEGIAEGMEKGGKFMLFGLVKKPYCPPSATTRGDSTASLIMSNTGIIGLTERITRLTFIRQCPNMRTAALNCWGRQPIRKRRSAEPSHYGSDVKETMRRGRRQRFILPTNTLRPVKSMITECLRQHTIPPCFKTVITGFRP